MTPQNIRDARAKLGMTRKELGAIMGMNYKEIQRVEMPSHNKTARKAPARFATVLDALLAGWRPLGTSYLIVGQVRLSWNVNGDKDKGPWYNASDREMLHQWCDNWNLTHGAGTHTVETCNGTEETQ